MTPEKFYAWWEGLDADYRPAFWRQATEYRISRYDLVGGPSGSDISLARLKVVWPHRQNSLQNVYNGVCDLIARATGEKPAATVLEPSRAIEAPAQEEAPAKPAKKRGRPRNPTPELPIHDVPNWEALEPACLDLLWRKPGMIIADLVKHLTVPDGNVKKAYALIHQSKEIEFRHSGVVKNTMRPLERLYPLKQRTGWYCVDKKGVGRLWGQRELARLAKVNRNALKFRLENGWTVKDAVSLPPSYLPGVDNENAA